MRGSKFLSVGLVSNVWVRKIAASNVAVDCRFTTGGIEPDRRQIVDLVLSLGRE